MTNSSPQEPQNPIPERRRRAAAGVTFDEMIAIVVAFGTIGSILFWSLAGRKGEFAGNFGLGNQNALLSGDRTGIELGSIDADSDVDFGDLEPDADSLALGSLSTRDNSASIADPSGFEIASGQSIPSYQLDGDRKLAPVAIGAAALPAFGDRPDGDSNLDSETTGVAPDETDTQATEPEVCLAPDETDTQATEPEVCLAPDAGVTPDETDGQATAPDAGVTPDETDTQATAPDAGVTPDETDTEPEIAEMPDDVAPSYWAYPFVKQMSDKQLVAALTEDADFEPDKLITRASMATLISQAFEDRPNTKSIKKFNDVTNKNAIAADIDKAVTTGFMKGYSDDEFRPLENIPRYQVLVTLATGLGLKSSQDADLILQKFDDGANMPDWAKEQVAAAAEAGLIVNPPGVASNLLSPETSATRAEVAAMIHQALVKTGKLQAIESEYILKP